MACRVLGSEHANIVATDMGGTSFEVGLILDGEAHIANTTWIGRHEIALPSVSVRTVGAGSGSIAGVEHGLLRVGPESAGAVPGPACYGRGGERPTVADADLVLGYLNPDNFLGGRLQLDVEAARVRRSHPRRRAARPRRSSRPPRASRRSSTPGWPT